MSEQSEFAKGCLKLSAAITKLNADMRAYALVAQIADQKHRECRRALEALRTEQTALQEEE
ncbi:MAG: hypothetical protein U5K75_08940 [Ahrensia sp.]|nr:hypothetical protein [Ahrensia sp.]